MASRPLIILGFGYTAQWIYRFALEQSLTVFATSRLPDLHLSQVEPTARLRFDLSDEATWGNLPLGADWIWTFPAAPLKLVQAFARHCCHPSQRLVVLSSTSAYDLDRDRTAWPPPWLDETAPINRTLPRVQGEEYLRNEHGATILRVAGIYGPGRNPVDWIEQGRVGPTKKFVNLIHVEDLAKLSLLSLREGLQGDTYNVSDGQPRQWSDICAEVARRWRIVSPRDHREDEAGKRISHEKILARFRYRLQYPDLLAALEGLQRSSVSVREPVPRHIPTHTG